MRIEKRRKYLSERIDILCFGAHSDDVEIGMGGTIAKYAQAGKKIIIVDLTEASLSSNGTVETRLAEANQAAQVLGVYKRENLHLQDRGLLLTEEKIKRVVEVIRKYQPKVIFSPYAIDRHPDHGACSQIVKEAIFSSGIHRFMPECLYPAIKVHKHYTYIINGFHKPDFYVDITDFMQIKLQALEKYQSQFVSNEESVKTPLTEGYVKRIESREYVFGKEIQCKFAEGFFHMGPFQIDKDWLG